MVFVAYINLARRTDRRAKMESQLARLGLEAQRIEALTPAEIEPPLLDRHTSRRHLFHVRPVELSCTLSHHKALGLFLASGHEHGLMLEDDVVLSPILVDLLASPLTGFDIMRLETYFDHQHHYVANTTTVGDFAVSHIASRCAGAAAYIVSRRAAQTILDAQEARSWPYDFVLFYPFRRPGSTLRTVQLSPALAVQEDRLDAALRHSDVQQPDDRTDRKPALLRAPHAIARFWETDIRINGIKTANRLLGRTRREIVPAAPDLSATNP